jgi:hypothetical protein
LKNCVINKDIGSFRNNRNIFFREVISHFKTFKRDIYQKTAGFNSNQKRAVDKDLILKMEEVTNFKFINQPLYYYRYHEGGISQGKNEFEAVIYFYIAKCKAYQRRLNTDIPNMNLRNLYFEFFVITFHRQINLMKNLNNRFRLFNLRKFFKNKYYVKKIIINLKYKILNLLEKLLIKM